MQLLDSRFTDKSLFTNNKPAAAKLLLNHFSRVWLYVTAAHQAPLSLGFSR